MKTKLFLTLIAFGLLFSACDKDAEFSSNGTSRDIAHLGDDYIFTVDDNNTTSTVLIAGQNQEVGRVEVKLDNDNITVTYYTDKGWYLTETHLHIAKDEKELFAQITNRAGNPRIGNFDYGTEKDIFQTSWEKVIPIANISPPSLDGCYVIAAHAVVAGLDAEGGGSVNLEAFAASLPETATFKILSAPGEGAPSYLPRIELKDDLGFFIGEYKGWCIETGKEVSVNRDYIAEVFSSSEEGSGYDADILKKLNWLINQNFVGKTYNDEEVFTYGDVQIVIWTLLYRNEGETWENWIIRLGEYIPDPLDDTFIGGWERHRIEKILEQLEENYGEFEFECEGSIAILLLHDDQDIIIEFPFPCYQDETAWGQGGLFDGNSWAMFFGVCPQK